ncbi:hypothetical protein ASD40_18520 [Paenibacillus sp. Root444D2]|nr:hypothetical protein ASD40_18520 [Paenibacillus sp. Root444D2]
MKILVPTSVNDVLFTAKSQAETWRLPSFWTNKRNDLQNANLPMICSQVYYPALVVMEIGNKHNPKFFIRVIQHSRGLQWLPMLYFLQQFTRLKAILKLEVAICTTFCAHL